MAHALCSRGRLHWAFRGSRRGKDRFRAGLSPGGDRPARARGAEPDLHAAAGLRGPGLSRSAWGFLSVTRRRGAGPAGLGGDDRGRRRAGRMAGARRRRLASGSTGNHAVLRRRPGRRIPPRGAPRPRRDDGALQARAGDRGFSRARGAEANRAPLHGDASSRAYERLTARDGATAILMISPPRASGPTLRFGKSYAEIARLSVDIRAFLAMAGGLRAQGYSTPRILARDIHRGLALIEDFGDETVADENGPNASRYAEATSLLADLHARALPPELPVGHETYTLPVYDIEAMSIEVELALDWYAPVIARGNPSSGARMQFLALWREILAPVLGPRTTWTLRDFHSPNLHWLAERDGLKRLGLIDFQDAVLGPPAYDLASLLQDARQAVAEDTEQRLLALYMRRRAQIDLSFDAPAFISAYSVMGAQRATKILGLFTRLDRRDGKPQYLQLLPRIERTLAKNLAHPVLEPLRQWFTTHLPRALGSAPAEES